MPRVEYSAQGPVPGPVPGAVPRPVPGPVPGAAYQPFLARRGWTRSTRPPTIAVPNALRLEDMSTSPLLLRAPISGILVPLERVPDPVFAQRIVGEGIAIEPVSSLLVAPCDGTVAHVHATGHAVTLTTPDGVEVLLHIGLDTVHLRGQGFRPRVAAGQTVACGAPLVEFDAGDVVAHAKRLLTTMVVTTRDRVIVALAVEGAVTAGVDVLLEARERRPATPSSGCDPSPAMSAPIRVPLAGGLHARPASRLAAAARGVESHVWVERSGERADARDVVELMSLDVRAGDVVRIGASGPDAEHAIVTLMHVLSAGLQEGAGEAVGPPAARQRVDHAAPSPPDSSLLRGASASPGVAIGRAWRARRPPVTIPDGGGNDIEAQRHQLEQAISRACLELDGLRARMLREADRQRAEIFDAQKTLLADPGLLQRALADIGHGQSAGRAWHDAVDDAAHRLAGLSNPLLATRADDLRDAGRRVLRLLAGHDDATEEAPERSILIAEELSPSDVGALDRSHVVGVCTTGGGATSHTAILARALRVPMVVGIDPRALDLADGTPLLLDAAAGTLRAHPPDAEVDAARARQRERSDVHARATARAMEPASTVDGHPITVMGNLCHLAEVDELLRFGGEGVGLLRSEFLAGDGPWVLDEDLLAERYGAIASSLGASRPVTIRTFDVGGDKPLASLPSVREPNPLLGERGIRFWLARPDLFRAHLRAVLRAASLGAVRVVFPMVALLDEWRSVKSMLEEERRALGVGRVDAGIMVEVPSVALMAEVFAREVDFFSIGTNDLAQYAMAMDRSNARLAPRIDALEPAVLRLIASTVDGARKYGRQVSICGAVADDEQAIPVLLGLGIEVLSVAVPAIPTVKSCVRTLRHDTCVTLARQALAAESAAAVRELVVRSGA